MVSRRSLLAVGGAALAGGTAGCRSLQPVTAPKLDLSVVNYTEREQTVDVRLLRNSEHNYRDAERYAVSVELPAGDPTSPVTETYENVAPRAPYIVRADVYAPNTLDRHYHFFPGEFSTEAEEARIVVRIYRAASGDGFRIEFM